MNTCSLLYFENVLKLLLYLLLLIYFTFWKVRVMATSEKLTAYKEILLVKPTSVTAIIQRTAQVTPPPPHASNDIIKLKH